MAQRMLPTIEEDEWAKQVTSLCHFHERPGSPVRPARLVSVRNCTKVTTMDLKLGDVNVLITGASGGIGLATVQLFLEQGARVAAQYNTNAATLQPLKQQYPSLILVQANVTSEYSVEDLFVQLIAAGFHTQIIILNHGISVTTDVPMADMSLDQWENTLAVNLTSNFLLARAYLKGLRRQTEEQKSVASIISIGSTAGKYGEANHADYASTKSAMMYGFTLSLKNEIVKIAPKGRVNCIAPGWVLTPMAEEAMKDPAVVYRSLATTPLKKVASAMEIAHQVIMLASPAVSSHVTGEVIIVAGGMEGRLLNLPQDVVLPSA